jgi:hypothetical protein
MNGQTQRVLCIEASMNFYLESLRSFLGKMPHNVVNI